MPKKVAACQVPDIRENIDASLEWIENFTKQAEEKDVSLICFPECFLQGYLTDERLAKKYAVNLISATFKTMLQRLTKYKPLIVFGLIEQDDDNLFNTAVVIKDGEFFGKYRKTHLLDGERVFKAGSEYPVFHINGLTFGINICYDTQFSEAAQSVAKQGATLILCPANNMMRYETAEKFKHLHHKMRIERVNETKVWLVSADVTGERNGRISYGPTSAINPNGQVVEQVPLMETGMIIVEVT
ncbi:MAG: carbon-nitrogen hydrolase family protein [Cyclobacteriaceae bacterium]|nr:carbon-nitrogen hydrolase family protein [Cyclobacteriaceae bacterium]